LLKKISGVKRKEQKFLLRRDIYQLRAKSMVKEEVQAIREEETSLFNQQRTGTALYGDDI